MRKILATLLAFTALSASSQQTAQQPVPPPPAGSNWQHVQALPIGTSIHVNAQTRHIVCNLASVDAETLTCDHGKSAVFQRTEIKSIKLVRRGRSAWVGAGVGMVTGAFIIGAGGGFKGLSGAGALVIGAPIGALIGAPIGALTDFSRSTVYKAP